MTSPESPAGARRRVRLALREARLARNLTQAEVAEAMDWSHSKVIRIENGEVTITTNDLRPLLTFLGITDKTVVDRLIQDARNSKARKMWWDDAAVKANLTAPSHKLIQYENEAVEIRHFTSFIIPGPLQTATYAEVMLQSHVGELDVDQIKQRLQTRKRRRNQLFGRANFPLILLLLDESVLKRRAGDARTTAEQLQDLLDMARERSQIHIRVLPYALNAPLPMFGQYDILTLPGTSEDAVLYRESHLADEVVEDPANVARHRGIFDQYWKASLTEAASADLIAESAKELIESASTTTLASGSDPRRESSSS
jgi:transcriptional regulator with XRE-family HTH domain